MSARPPPVRAAGLIHSLTTSCGLGRSLCNNTFMRIPGTDSSVLPHNAAMESDQHATAHAFLPDRLRKFIAHIQRCLQPVAPPEPARHLPQTTPSKTTQRKTSLGQTAALAQRIPSGAWDSHMHIVDPDSYPLAQGAAYRPSAHSLDDALAFEASVGIPNIVLVQPSIYGHDNACLLAALHHLGPRRARAVVSFDPEAISESQLREWHQLGVRGVRVNIRSQGAGRSIDPGQLADVLRRYADVVRPLGWVLQAYVPMWLLEPLEPVIAALDVRFCIDHMGVPDLEAAAGAEDPYGLAGFSALARLLEGGHTFVKLSAPYRMSRTGGHADLEPVAREIIHLRGRDRVVFATDWPHTRFEGLDIRPWMEAVLDWCGGDEVLVDRLFRGNAEELWDVP